MMGDNQRRRNRRERRSRRQGRQENPPVEADVPENQPAEMDEPDWDQLQEALIQRDDDPEGLLENDAVRPLVYTPEEERFPPIPDEPAAAMPQVKKPLATARSRRRRGNWRHDVIALFFFLGTLSLIAYYAYIWENPFSPLNPLAKPTPFIEVTWTPDPNAAIAAQMTAQGAVQPAPTVPVVLPMSTDPPSVTPPTTISATLVPTAAANSENLAAYTLSDAGVQYVANTNGRGCNWASIAGTVADAGGAPVKNYSIRIIDAREPERLDVRVFSGTAPTFGEGGFEFNLAGSPREGQFIVQLYDLNGVSVSDEVMIITRDVCSENIALIEFVQVQPG